MRVMVEFQCRIIKFEGLKLMELVLRVRLE